MVNTKEQGGEETIRSLVSRLLEKRGLRYTSFDVFPTGGGGGGGGSSEKPLDLASHCSVLMCTEVRVEPRVLFRYVTCHILNFTESLSIFLSNHKFINTIYEKLRLSGTLRRSTLSGS